MIHICNLRGLFKLCECVSSNVVFDIEKSICHKIYIFHFCGPREVYECVFILSVHLSGPRELYECLKI